VVKESYNNRLIFIESEEETFRLYVVMES